MTRKREGADVVWEALLAEGVDVVFGHPGGAILPVYDASTKYPIRHVLARHEQGAAHMADGYARATGRVGVAMATSGPGALNLVTGLATAMMDSVPIVAITGQVPTYLLGTDAFQETDVVGVTLPITKHNFLVTDVNELPWVLRAAFKIARTGRPGPVLVDICKDVQTDLTDRPLPDPEDIHIPGLERKPTVDIQAVRRAAELINNASRPLIIAGHGVLMAHAERELQALAEKAGIPVTTTLLGIGSIPETHPLALGMSGMHGEAVSNFALQECDVLIAVGMRFDDRVTGKLEEFAPKAKIVHFELDPSEVGKNVEPTVAVVVDAKESLQLLLPLIKERRHPEWMQRLQRWKEESQERDAVNVETEELIPPQVIRELWYVTEGNALIASDVGQHQMWEAQYFMHQRPNQLFTSGGLGTMGYGLPAAIGAQVGKPEEKVWAVVGDGGFQMTIQELGTVAQEKVPVKIAIIRNGYLGMVRQWQQLFYERRYAATPILSPDFVKLAEAYGIPARRVTRRSELHEALKEAHEADTPYLLDLEVVEEFNVYPMVAPGERVDNMLRRPLVPGENGLTPAW